MEKIRDYFKRYPNSTEVFENGGKLFHTRGAADSFGKGETKRYTREQTKDEKPLDGAESSETKEMVILKIKETEDFSTIPYFVLKAWAKTIDLKTEDNKNETLVKAFVAFKETLKDE